MAILEADSIIYQDEDLAAIYKPSLCHSVSLESGGPSLVRDLPKIMSFKEAKFKANPNDALLQRLDFETSGVMLVAKTDAAFENLKNQIKEHKIKKTYLLVVDGPYSEPLVARGYLGSRYRHSQKVTILDTARNRYLFAETAYSAEKYLETSRLTIVKAETNYGRRHQVRAQAAGIGFPLAGDRLYGDQTVLNLAGRDAPPFILHAWKITFAHPKTGKEMTVTAELPEYLSKLS